MSVTPASLLVVAPAVELAGHHACGLARTISSGGRLSVRYSVISGSKLTPAGTAARDALFVGQRLLGRGDRRAQVGHDDGAAKLGGRVGHDGVQGSPSRTCRCQSSGRVMVRVWVLLQSWAPLSHCLQPRHSPPAKLLYF